MIDHFPDFTRANFNPYLGKRLRGTATLQKYGVRHSLRYTLTPLNNRCRSRICYPRSWDKRQNRKTK